jgi:3-hydroxyisobutyrate dehydrogenase-like beta-hydroxyacid dehydrogenase
MSADSYKGNAPRLAFIGLGDMGRGMAVNLAKAGHPLKVLDLRPEAMVDAVAAGATAAKDLKEIVDFADIIHLCLVYDEQILKIITGDEGIIALGRPGQIVVIHSTVLPSAVEQCTRAARAAGMDVLDAAVSGGAPRSIAGTLTIMVGGTDETFERCKLGLDAMGTSFHVGDVGTGQAMKLTNNVMGICNRLIYLEALQIAEAYGISEEMMNEIISDSSGMSYAQVHHRRTDLRNENHTLAGSTEFPYRLSKDLRYAAQVGLDRLLPLPITALAAQIAPDSYARRWARVAEERVKDKE